MHQNDKYSFLFILRHKQTFIPYPSYKHQRLFLFSLTTECDAAIDAFCRRQCKVERVMSLHHACQMDCVRKYNVSLNLTTTELKFLSGCFARVIKQRCVPRLRYDITERKSQAGYKTETLSGNRNLLVDR